MADALFEALAVTTTVCDLDVTYSYFSDCAYVQFTHTIEKHKWPLNLNVAIVSFIEDCLPINMI
jgi:hypothetical protein